MMFRSLSQFKQIGDRAKERKQPCLFPPPHLLPGRRFVRTRAISPENGGSQQDHFFNFNFTLTREMKRPDTGTETEPMPNDRRRWWWWWSSWSWWWCWWWCCAPDNGFRDSDRNRSRIAESNFYFGAKKVDRSSRFDQLLLTRSTLCEMFVKGGRM